MKEQNRNLALRVASAAVLAPLAIYATWNGGLFFAGHAESLLDNGRHFRLRGQTVYVRVEGSVRT